MKPIKEQVLEDALVQTLNEMVADKDRIMNNLERNISTIISNTPVKDVKELERQLQGVERKMVELSKHSPQTHEDQIKNAELMDKAVSLREEIAIAERHKDTHDMLHQRMKEIRQVIRLPYHEYQGK